MLFSDFAIYLQRLEQTAARNTITEILAELFHHTPPSDIEKICYLLQGRVVPLYEPLEFGVADKMMIRALAQGLTVRQDEVLVQFKKTGDLGSVAEELKVKSQKSKVKTTTQKLKVEDVYQQLLAVAQASGEGSQEEKVALLADLLACVDPLSARFITRIPLGKLRLGFSDMTILDGLSWMMKGTKEHKKELEAAYNVRPDLGVLARIIKEKGIDGIAHIKPAVGTPIMMARANRLSSPGEILQKIGRCAVEFKYDGLRLQMHYDRKIRNSKFEIRNKLQQESLFQKEKNTIDASRGGKIKMFSRNLEEITRMFPDIAQAVIGQIDAESCIIEGEVVAYNPETGVFVPFQETMQRKRKYDIAAKALEIPVKLFAFELLYCNGTSFVDEPYEVRKKELKRIVKKGDTLVYAQETVVADEAHIEDLFEQSVKLHFEGIIAKKLDGRYEAGMRGWSWIKYKKAMDSKLNDTIDTVVMGYTRGEGKRTSFGVGQFLVGVYDEKNDRFVTVSKIGTGLTDEQFREFITRVKPLETKTQPIQYDFDKLLTPDVWLMPQLVVEIACDEITRSAVHTAGRIMTPSKSGKAFSVKTPGFALRFPRLVRFRDDKKPTDATTVKEIARLYTAQKKN